MSVTNISVSNIKGTDVAYIKKLFKSKPAQESEFLSRLDEGCKNIYGCVLSSALYPLDRVAKIYEAAAHVLYPGDRDAVKHLFEEIAQHTYSGIYSIFLKIPSVSFVVKQAAGIWRTYYDTGTAGIENLHDKSLRFCIYDFPTLPKAMRDATEAHITVLMSKAGARNIQIATNESNPLRWEFSLRWN